MPELTATQQSKLLTLLKSARAYFSGVERVGVAQKCAVCGHRKSPRGRAAPLIMSNGMCDRDCEGYMRDPRPGSLWPGETLQEFGYPRELVAIITAIDACEDITHA